ncbi:hypothetical protein ACE6H2_002477 [Prunus campanulata]
MAVPLLNKAIVKKRVKQFKRPQSDRKVSVKVLDAVLGHSDDLFRRAQLKALVSIHGKEAGKGGELTHDETTIISGALNLVNKGRQVAGRRWPAAAGRRWLAVVGRRWPAAAAAGRRWPEAGGWPAVVVGWMWTCGIVCLP